MGIGSLPMAYRYAVALSIAVILTFLAGAIVFFYNRRKVSRTTRITTLEEARAEVAGQVYHRNRLSKFGTRSIRSGHYGGAFHAYPPSPKLYPRSGSLPSMFKKKLRVPKSLLLSTSSSSIISMPSPVKMSSPLAERPTVSEERRESQNTTRASKTSSRRFRASDLDSIGKPSTRSQPKIGIAVSEPNSPTSPKHGRSFGDATRIDFARDIQASSGSFRRPSDSDDSYFPKIITKPVLSYSRPQSLRSRTSLLCDSFPAPPSALPPVVLQRAGNPFIDGTQDDGYIRRAAKPAHSRSLGGSLGALPTPPNVSARKMWGKTIFQEIDNSIEDLSPPESKENTCQYTKQIEPNSRSIRTSSSSSIYSSRDSEYFGNVSPRGRQMFRQSHSPLTPSPREPISPLSFTDVEPFPTFELPHISETQNSELADLYDSYQQHHAKFSKADLGFVVKPGDASEQRRDVSNISGGDSGVGGNFI